MGVVRRQDGRRRRRPFIGYLAPILVLGACADTYPHRVETCTSVVNGINIGVEAIDILSTVDDPRTDDIRVNYRIRSGGQSIGRVQWVICHFEEPDLGESKPDLIAVDTNAGPLGEGQLFVLKRWWLQHSFAAWQRDEG